MNTQAPRLLHPRAKGLHRLTTPQCCTLEHAGGTRLLHPRAKHLHRVTTAPCCTLEHAEDAVAASKSKSLTQSYDVPVLHAGARRPKLTQPKSQQTTSQRAGVDAAVRAGEVLRRGVGEGGGGIVRRARARVRA